MDRVSVRDARRKEMVGRDVRLHGWVRTRRDSKAGFSFVEVNDGSCLANIQMICDGDLPNYESEIKSLCAAGKRDAAQQEALAFAMEMNNNPDIRKMRECGEKMRGMMPPMPYLEQSAASETSDRHVCDD